MSLVSAAPDLAAIKQREQATWLDLIARFNRADDGTMVVPIEYLEAVIIKR